MIELCWHIRVNGKLKNDQPHGCGCNLFLYIVNWFNVSSCVRVCVVTYLNIEYKKIVYRLSVRNVVYVPARAHHCKTLYVNAIVSFGLLLCFSFLFDQFIHSMWFTRSFIYLLSVFPSPSPWFETCKWHNTQSMCWECDIEWWAFSYVITVYISIGWCLTTVIQIIDTSIITITIHCIAIILLMRWIWYTRSRSKSYHARSKWL